MNESFVLSCCSTVDLTPETLASRNIHFARFHYTLDEKEYFDDMGQSLSMPEFYQAMVNGAEAHTAQINVEEYCQYFAPFLAQGKDILHLTLSSGLSGSFNSARIAAGMLKEQYPDRRILVVDSRGASSGSGLIALAMADLRDAGKTMDEIYDWVEEHKLEMHYWFCSTDLTFYVKGGRITKAAGWFGTVLKICPVLNMDAPGTLSPRFKVRGKQNALRDLVKQMEQHANNGHDYDGPISLCHSNCLADAEAIAATLKELFPKHNGEIHIYDIGPTIGCHSGPGTVAVFFWGDKRTD